MESESTATAGGSRVTRAGRLALSAGQGCGAGPLGQRGRLAGRGGAAPRAAPPPAAANPIAPSDTAGGAEAHARGSHGVDPMPSPRGERRRGADTERHPDESPNTRARTAAARAAADENERHRLESPNTRSRTAAGIGRGGRGGMSTGQLTSASQQRGPITGANLNRTTGPAEVAGRGGNIESPNTRARTTAAGRGTGGGGMTSGRLASALQQRGPSTGANLNRLTGPAVAGQGGSGRIAGQLLATAAPHRGQPVTANLNRTFADAAATNNAAANQGGPAERVGGNTGGDPTIQHGTRLARVSTAFMHDKCVKEHIFPKQKFASLHGDLDFSNNPQSICRTMAAALEIAEEEVEGWWESSKLSLHKSIKTHRNNVIKTIKNIVKGKA